MGDVTTNVGSSIFYSTLEDKELQPASVTANTTAALSQSQADAVMSDKPGFTPRRPIPLPRGAIIPSSPQQTKRELPRPPISPRKPSEVNGSPVGLSGDWKYMTLPTKGSPPWKRPNTVSDDMYLSRGKGNGKPPLPSKPTLATTGKPVCMTKKSLNNSSVTGESVVVPISVRNPPASDIRKLAGSPVSVIPFVSVTDKPVSAVTGNQTVSHKLSSSVQERPAVPLKPPHTVSLKPSSPARRMKCAERNSVEQDDNVQLPRTPGRSHSGSSISSSDSATERRKSCSDVLSTASDGHQSTQAQARPIPPPRTKLRLGTGCVLNGCQDKQMKTDVSQGQSESPTIPDPKPRNRPIPPPRNQTDSAQRVHHLATKLSLLPPGVEPVKLTSPSSPEINGQRLASKESSPAGQPLKPPSHLPRDHMDGFHATRSLSDLQDRQSSHPVLPQRSTTVGSMSPTPRRHLPVQKSGSAEQLLASVVTKAGLSDVRSLTLPKELSDNRQKKQLNGNKTTGSLRRKSKPEKKMSVTADSRRGSASCSDDEDGAGLKPSPSLRRRINGAFSMFKRALGGGGKKENEVEDVGQEDNDDDTLPQLSVAPKLRHVSISWRRQRSSSGVSDTDEDRSQLFQYVRVVSLEPDGQSSKLKTVVKYQFPPAIATQVSRDEQATLEAVPAFCFPDLDEWKPVTSYKSETYSFVLTDIGGEKRFGYCRRLLPSGKCPRLPEVYCIISPHGCFELYSKILDAVEQRRSQSASAVFTFLQAVIAQPFPSPGRAVKVKAFASGKDEMEELILRRPLDSARLEHVDFKTLFSKLGVDRMLSVFAAMLMERHIIFSASKLSTLSDCVHAAAALLYPFSWQHVYIPVLPMSLMDFCCAPSPYIMGVLSSSLDMLDMELVENDVLIVDFDNGKFVREVGDEGNILPPKLCSALKSAIRPLDGKVGSDLHGDDMRSADSAVIVEAFVRFFVETVGHYHDYLAPDISEEFNMEAFVKVPRSKSIKRFLGYFKNTQMFQMFVDQRADPQYRDTLHKSLFERRIRECETGGGKAGKGRGFGGKLRDFSFSKVISKAKESGALIKKKFRGGIEEEVRSDDN